MDQLAPKTNDLITLGADLAAQYGGSTADAVEALSAVFKGETDPIEKYGVSIKQSDIAAQKAAMGMSNLTGEADKQATAQATLALLTKQTADATGANAREADTAAGKQARLTAAWDDASAKMGAELLPAFTGLMDAASNLVPMITPLVSTLGDLVSAASQLPVPLLAAGAGLAVFLKNSDGLRNAFSGMRSGSLSAGEGFKALGKSLALGGAVGLAAAGLSVIVGAFENASKHAQEMRDRTAELADELVKTGGKWTKAADDMVTAQFKTSNAWKLAQQAGIPFNDALALATGKMQNLTVQSQELKDASGWVSVWDKWTHSDAAAGLNELSGGLKNYGQEAQLAAVETNAYNIDQKGMAAINAAAGQSIDELVQSFLPVPAAALSASIAHQQAAAAAKKHGEALAKYRESAAAAATAQSDLLQSQLEAASAGSALQTALDGSAKSADDTTRAVSGLNIILDQLSGHSRTADQTAADLNQSFIDMRETFKSAAKSGDLNTAALANWNVKALTTNQTGQDVFDKLNKVRDAYTAATAGAYASAAATKGVAGANTAARDAAQSAYLQFLKTATGLGLSDTQARKLAESLGIVEGKKLTDKQMSIIAKDKAAKDALAAFEAKKLADKNANINAVAHTAQAKADLDAAAADRTVFVTLKYQGGAPNAIGGRNGPNTGPRMVGPDAAAMYPAGLPSAFAAPTAGLYASAPAPTATAQVNITVQGAVDPDRTARQIKGHPGRPGPPHRRRSASADWRRRRDHARRLHPVRRRRPRRRRHPRRPDLDAPTALTSLSVTWGRATTVDQVEPSTCTFDADGPARRRVVPGPALHRRPRRRGRPAPTSPAPACPINVDGGFEYGHARHGAAVDRDHRTARRPGSRTAQAPHRRPVRVADPGRPSPSASIPPAPPSSRRRRLGPPARPCSPGRPGRCRRGSWSPPAAT